MKKNSIKYFYFLLAALLLGMSSSCVPTPKTNSRTVKQKADEIGGDTTTRTEENPNGGNNSGTSITFSRSVVWFANQPFDSILSINSNYSDSLYLRGTGVQQFVLNDQPYLSISQKRYCLVVSFKQSVANFPLRLIATPFLFNDGMGSSDYGLKIHITDKVLNQSNCGGNVALYNYPENSTSTVSEVLETANGAYNLPDLCPTCSGAETSQDVRIYRVASNNLIDQDWLTTPRDANGNFDSNGSLPQDLELQNLQLRIDYGNVFEETSSQCTNSTCRAEGFDCCVDGFQCANDGQERPETTNAFACLRHEEENDNDFSRCAPEFNASSYNNIFIQFSQAYYDSKVFGDKNFLRYPNFYFTCSSTTPEPFAPETTGPENPEQDAEERLNQLISEFNCLEEGKKDNPEFSSNQTCPPTFDQAAYTQTRLKVWKDCGCEADPFPTQVDDLRCPDFGLTAIKNETGEIIRVECYTPPVLVETPPFQVLDLAVQNRSVPHRFFAEDGTEYEDITKIGSASNIFQEGDQFSYLNESAKQGPQFGGPGADITNQGFGMNSILGPINIGLDRALPAKVVKVEFDQFYIISVNSGFYTPCPQCIPDSWFPTFKSLPGSTNGLGVIATGYTTSRSEYRDNYSLGNYEDTKFGRACWVPPTMLPFSHKPYSDSQTQRLNRLKTQAALYANGYQRDWYGFNQGALIGSFDGVTWFAIGKGRRVRATSEKLYLAINAPFADLADPGSTTVSIVVDLGSNIAAEYDFIPELELNHPAQNEAGTCQSYHQCNNDTDCITQLGWEYSCLDINELRSHWPKFNVDGKEKENSQLANQSWDQILNGGILSENSKRCVYRGMGALCKQDYTNLSATRPDLQKAFRCAPNFYCADLSSSQFNDNVVRSPNQLSLYFYGHEADFLGRPQNYIGANRSLHTEIQENLIHNLRIFSGDTSGFGLCRPGKSLESSNDLTNHANIDLKGRTDYISQIGSCDSQATGNQRTQTCPLIENNPDSENFGNIIDGNQSSLDDKLKQNMCGGESKFFDGSERVSTFNEIELEKISSLFSLTTPALAADACLRRAGEVCFSNLDCGPNRLHSEQAVFLSTDRFGGTDAEKNFWSESLVCSQSAELPTLQADNFYDYDLTQNRCCREIASDFTMFSKIDEIVISPDIGDEKNLNLDIENHTAIDPNRSKRYSRYNALDLISGSQISPTYSIDVDDDGKFDSTEYVIPEVAQNSPPDKFQWRTFQESGKLTCCGGGWVRKFADGTQDWSNNLRQNYNTTNFRCLNYQDKMYKEKPNGTTEGTYSKDKSKLCFTPDKKGCVQTPMNEDGGDGFAIVAPQSRGGDDVSIDTTPTEQGDLTTIELSRSAPYVPIVAQNGNPFETEESGAGDGKYFPYWIGHHESTGTQPLRSKHAISILLPIYVGSPANITSIEIHYEHESLEPRPGQEKNQDAAQDQNLCRALEDVSIKEGYDTFLGATEDNANEVEPGEDKFCIQYTGDQYVLHISARFNPGIFIDPGPRPPDATEQPWTWAGVKINFRPIGATGQRLTENDGKVLLINRNPGNGISTLAAADSGLIPGNSLYYLSKLGRFDLTGIPQIFFEPLYCNDDRSQLVPGLFNPDITNRSEFETESFTYSSSDKQALEKIYDPDYNGTDGSKDDGEETRVVFQDKVQLNQVFSGHEFRCCAKLGSLVSSSSRCCSGHAIQPDNQQFPNADGKLICKLPQNTNLNVYFNRFVSSEGSIEDNPEFGLTENDFVPETGEPKIQSSTYTKLANLASRHCESGESRKGASFGRYPAQPNSGFFFGVENEEDTFYFSMVDSSQDFDGEDEKGFDYFIFGIRWDHHFYCK